MKTFYLLIATFLFGISSVNAQLFSEYFSGNDFPPTGWTTVDFDYEHWHTNYNTNYAGGVAPECMLDWYPYTDVGVARLISPSLDFSEYSTISLSFKHNCILDFDNFEIGVATRSNEGEWNIVWNVIVEETIDPETRTVNISNDDLISSDFQFCLYFDGDFYNFGGWYIDDIEVNLPVMKDVAVTRILGDRQFMEGENYLPEAMVQNIGAEPQSFDVSCTVTDFETGSVEYTNSLNLTLEAGMEEQISFTDFIIPENAKTYGVSISTLLSGDENPDNDELTKFINTWTQQRQKVLVEVGTATWCGNCSSAAIGVFQLDSLGYEVSVIEHHSSDDYDIPDSQARLNYLGINGYPSAIFDADLEKSGGCPSLNCFDDYLPLYNQSKSVRTPINISITTEEISTGNYNVNVLVEKIEPLAENNLKLRLALTESHIYHPWGQSPPLDYLDFVNRGFFPDAEGITIDLVNNTSISQDYTINLSEYNILDNEHCELVAFVESDYDKYVYQTAEINLGTITSIYAKNTDEFNIYPNPSTGTINILPNNSELSTVNYAVSNMLGQVLLEGTLSNGENAIHISGLQNGYYYLSIETNNSWYTRKIVLLR